MNSPWLEISSRGFFFETHLVHVPLCGGSVPCHLLGGAVFFDLYGESAAGVALGVRVGSGEFHRVHGRLIVHAVTVINDCHIRIFAVVEVADADGFGVGGD